MHNANMNSMRTHRLKSIIWGLVAAIPILVILLVSGVQEAQSVLSYIGSSIFTSYVIFAFVFTMFYDTFVKDAVLGMLGKTVSWPGLIFTFDLDGILWLIGMKLLFAVLGFIIGVLAAILGILFGMILSVFACPIILISYSQTQVPRNS